MSRTLTPRSEPDARPPLRHPYKREDFQPYQARHDHIAPGGGPARTGAKAGSAETAFEAFRGLSPDPHGRASPIPLTEYHTRGQQQQHQQHGPRSSALRRFWDKNKPAVLVASAQLFGALMNLSARLLELDGAGMHPFQVLLIRQTLTATCCLLYMWYSRTPDFPCGPRGLRKLLALRGVSGFFGIYGMWYSMMYLPLADATVITFLAPSLAGLICYFVLREPFTRTEMAATLVALTGVVLIAQPAAFFATDPPSATAPAGSEAGTMPGLEHESTPEERLLAIAVALLGVLGAAGAFTSLRAIGKRAHPLISVNFFAMTCIVVCGAVLVLAPALDIGQPALSWRTPRTLWQWCLMFALGAAGFIMQYLLTSGLAADKSNRANGMVYTHMLWAAAFDRWVFGHNMGLMSFAGCSLIMGSAVTVVMSKKKPTPAKAGDVETQGNQVDDFEHSSMLIRVSESGRDGQTR
jgi:drug/metabolite transporter (DMT)-like permease